MKKEKQPVTVSSTQLKQEEKLFNDIRKLLESARGKIARSVNSTVVQTYWKVGKYIVEFEQQGYTRAEYGKSVIDTLSKRLVAEFGNGFTATNLRYMRQFYLLFPIYHTVCDKLTWSHCRTVIKVQDETARIFYLEESVAENWSVRQLDRQINTMYYERLLASRDKKAVAAEIQKSAPKTLEPKEIIHDPYILEFLGLPQDIGQMQMYVNYYTRELMNEGDNPPIGIILCADKNDAVVKYTLPENEKQVFAAKYMTYLPTQEELKRLLQTNVTIESGLDEAEE